MMELPTEGLAASCSYFIQMLQKMEAMQKLGAIEVRRKVLQLWPVITSRQCMGCVLQLLDLMQHYPL
jgi:hypothetical protein